MTCKIERVLTPDGFVVLRVSGRIDGTYVATLLESMEKEKTTKSGLAIDLTGRRDSLPMEGPWEHVP